MYLYGVDTILIRGRLFTSLIMFYIPISLLHNLNLWCNSELGSYKYICHHILIIYLETFIYSVFINNCGELWHNCVDKNYLKVVSLTYYNFRNVKGSCWLVYVCPNIFIVLATVLIVLLFFTNHIVWLHAHFSCFFTRRKVINGILVTYSSVRPSVFHPDRYIHVLQTNYWSYRLIILTF